MKHSIVLAALLGFAGFAAVSQFLPRAHAQASSPSQTALEEGKRLYRTNCAGCHKWHGNGGGGYGGDALSLRRTSLTKEQIILTVECGRPGTGMPYHLRDAYENPEKMCYGYGKDEPPPQKVLEANNFLRPSEIELIVDYVLARIKGHGAPDYAECIDFFGNGSRVCNIYKSMEEPATGLASAKGE
jgi:mono/diheme cytochrome c family protein